MPRLLVVHHSWEQAAATLETTGELSAADREAAWELGATLALTVAGNA